MSTDPNGYTCDGERWWGSNYGVTTQDAAGAVDLIAPTILPTTDIQGSAGYDSGDYSGFFNGTSCATPYAAGVAALVKSANPSYTPAQIREAIVTGADDVVNVESGAGWDRWPLYWFYIETSPGNFDWSRQDTAPSSRVKYCTLVVPSAWWILTVCPARYAS